MKPIRRLLLPILTLAIGLVSQALPGAAQSPGSSRFAFADTTLLRDTLGLKFDRLFQVADSLNMLPDSLRAQVIRFRLPIHRLLAMADSMGVPVDSVGDVITRERFNLLTSTPGAPGATTFKYTSGYTVGITSTSWTNGGDYALTRGQMVLHNGTTIQMDRTNSTGGASLHQERHSTSELNWRIHRNLLLGGQAVLDGFDLVDPGSVGSNQSERKYGYNLSARAKTQPFKDLNSDFNLLTGFLDLKNFSQVKRGLSGDFNGRVRYLRGNWLSHDLTGGINGNLSRTGKPTSIRTLGTSDFSGSLRGALQLYQASPVGLNLNYSVRDTRVETPTDSETVNRLLTSGATVDATMRLRASNDRYVNITGNKGRNTTLQGTRDDDGARAQGRWVQGLWAFDADYSDLIGDSQYPRRNNAYGYGERQDNRAANATLTRPFGAKITAKLSSSISLSQFRSRALSDSASPPTPRDNYRQSYRVEALYNQSDHLNSGVALEVALTRVINLPAQSTSNNTDTRTYRAEWRWSYRMLRGLTASQSNTVQADYEFFPFASERNDLSLDFNSVTSLSAVLTPRLTVQVTHNARQQPRGDLRTLADGTAALLPSDQSLTYTLRTVVTWTPSPALSFTLTPDYLADDQTGTSNGAEVPTRRARRLNFSGGANLNLKLGRKGTLTGNIARQFSSNRSTSFLNGVPLLSPVSEQDYWNGTLALSWEL